MTYPTPTVRDQVVADATSLPDLIKRASVVDPALAAVLTGQATAASKTPIGGVIGGVVGLAAAHYGLNWGVETDQIVAGFAVLAGGYVAHWMTARPSLFTTKEPTP